MQLSPEIRYFCGRRIDVNRIFFMKNVLTTEFQSLLIAIFSLWPELICKYKHEFIFIFYYFRRLIWKLPFDKERVCSQKREHLDPITDHI